MAADGTPKTLTQSIEQSPRHGSYAVMYVALCLALSLASVRPANAEDALSAGATADAGATASADAGAESFYRVGDDGEIMFTQALSWEADPYALRYAVTVRDASGKTMVERSIEGNRLEFSLGPGTYEYNIVTYNLLDQAETESGWQAFTVIKAEIPSLEDVTPAFIYMDALDGRITLVGSRLVEGGAAYLVDANGRKDRAIELSREGDTAITVTFEDEAFRPGTYDMVVVNPGGIEDSLERSVKILFQRPVDILASAGYAPISFVADAWFTETWPNLLNPLGAAADLDVFFLKQGWGFLGTGLNASGFFLSGGNANATIKSSYLLAGADALYKYRFTRAVHGVARVGGGVAWSHHRFVYGDLPGPETSSSDPYVSIGAAAQYFLPKKMFVEGGAAWIAILENGHVAQGIRPTLKFGYQVF